MFFDVIFISYHEPNADENFEKLLEIAPHAQRVHGVKGIAQAHIAASKLVSTSHFFTVDADNIVDDNFDWERIIDFQNNDKRIHVWRAKNPVNGLIYGYGGLKLWPTNHIENIQEYATDFTTSVATHGFKVQNILASTTHFNTDGYNAWRSGFRECTKLSSGMIKGQIHDETLARLKIWTSVGLDAEYGDYAIAGARMGVCYGSSNQGGHQQDRDNLNDINDFDYCHHHFKEEAVEVDPMEVIIEYGKDMDGIHNIETTLFTAEQSKLLKEIFYKI